jgi:excisionase family DNA binding protein
MDEATILSKLKAIQQKLDELHANQKAVLTFDEAVRYLCVSSSTLYKLTFQNKISFSKPGGKLIYFIRSDLDKWLLQNRVPSTEEIKEQSLNYMTNKKNNK